MKNVNIYRVQVQKEAMGIAGFTGTRGSAVQDFIDKHELDAVKLLKSMKSANLQGRLNFVSALVGKDGNPNQRLTIKLHKKELNTMSKRIIECKDGHKFIDVTDIAKLLWESASVELYELDDDGIEHLINDKEDFDKAVSESKIVIE